VVPELGKFSVVLVVDSSFERLKAGSSSLVLEVGSSSVVQELCSSSAGLEPGMNWPGAGAWASHTHAPGASHPGR